MSLDLARLRPGDVVAGRGRFDGRLIQWDRESFTLARPLFLAGDPVAWPPAARVREVGQVLGTHEDRDGTLLLWVLPTVGGPKTLLASEVERLPVRGSPPNSPPLAISPQPQESKS